MDRKRREEVCLAGYLAVCGGPTCAARPGSSHRPADTPAFHVFIAYSEWLTRLSLSLAPLPLGGGLILAAAVVGGLFAVPS